ncbi:MAG: rhodanese-like domain-containing protein [Halobacteriales archaeon]
MVRQVTAAEVKEKLDNGGDIQVIDIRLPRQFKAGHIPGAENIPFSEFPKRVQEFDWGDEIVVVCPKGESSQQACRLLESYEGVDESATVCNLEEGYRGWDYELETE